MFTIFKNLTVVAAIVLSTGCGGGGGGTPGPPPVPTNAVTGVSVSPGTASLEIGQDQQFTPTVTGTGTFDSTVHWSVNNIQGGSNAVGLIDDKGFYTAPNAVPNPTTVTVTASSVADPTKAGNSATTIKTGTPSAGPALSVDVASARHAISADIYGMNSYGLESSFIAEIKLPVSRWGGNATSRYNYKYDITNSGADYYFESFPSKQADPLNNSAFNQLVVQNQGTNTKTIGTVPLIGWTTKAPPNGSNIFCGFSVARYGAQQKTDPFDADCGNGVKPDGTTNVTANNTADTSVATDYNFVHDWVAYLVSKFGDAAHGGVAIYSLDNEPNLWNGTHRDVHPTPTTYDEMQAQTYTYARAVKDADPTAATSGPVPFGWREFFYSAKDWQAGYSTGPNFFFDSNPVDFLAHGSIPYLDWYLQKMSAYEKQNGVRILDYLDVHGYVSPDGISFQPAGGASLQALRLGSTRALWDINYTMNSGEIRNQVVRLIPRLHDWVNNNYPGTKTAITEYNWGALDHINGALAQADILGIFGREGLDLATIWGPPKSSDPGAFAFRMYRNYDATGRQFGDTSVQATSGDQSLLAIYAAQRAADGVLTLIVINKTNHDLTSAVSLAGFTPSNPAKVFLYGATNWKAIVPQPDQAMPASGFSATFPAWSITLFAVPGL